MNSCACARAGGRFDLLARGVRARVGDVLGDRRREQEGSSLTTAIARRSERRLDLAHVGAVEQHLPARSTSYSREISDTRLVLPEPVAPTSATVRPAGTSRSMSCRTARRARAGLAPLGGWLRRRAERSSSVGEPLVVAQASRRAAARGRCRRAAPARRAARSAAARGRAAGRCARPRRSRAGRGRASRRASASARSACSGRSRTR